jgi:hypothetical protein
MTIFDYLIGLGALGLILWNMRRHEMTDRTLLRPLLIAGGVCAAFLHTVPTTGADGALVALGLAVGAGCGLVSALATRVERDGRGVVHATGTPLAIGVTAFAFLGRLGFAAAATNGLGPAIGRFSRDVGIHSEQAWVASLVLMAVADLAVRAIVLWHRRRALTAGAPLAAGARSAI